MPTTYITDAALKSQVAAELGHASSGDNALKADVIVPWANVRAAGTIQRKLVARGYTLAQIADWDHLEEYAIGIGLCWAMIRYANLAADDKWVEKLRALEEELDTVLILIDGEIGAPEGGNGMIGYGLMTRSDDIWSLDTEW